MAERWYDFDKATLKLETLEGRHTVTALNVPNILTPMNNLINQPLLNLSHLQGLQLAYLVSHVDSFVISVLIGADYYWDFVENHIICGPGTTAVISKFVYLLSGPAGWKEKSNLNTTMLHLAATTCDEESDKLQNFWDLKTVGIKDGARETGNNEFELYLDTYLRFENGKYVAKLPWNLSIRRWLRITLLGENAQAIWFVVSRTGSGKNVIFECY